MFVVYCGSNQVAVDLCSVPVSFPCRLHSTLELLEVDKSDGQAGKVAHVVVKQLGGIKHAIIKAPVADLEIKFYTSNHQSLMKCVVVHQLFFFVTVEESVKKIK